MSKSNQLTVRLPSEMLATLEKYQDEYALTVSQAVRIAIDRLLHRSPSAQEIAQAHSLTGAAAHTKRGST